MKEHEDGYAERGQESGPKEDSDLSVFDRILCKKRKYQRNQGKRIILLEAPSRKILISIVHQAKQATQEEQRETSHQYPGFTG